MSGNNAMSTQSHSFSILSFPESREAPESTNSSSSTDNTPSQTPTQEIPTSMMDSTLSQQNQTRGRPRYRRRQQSRRYFTPPSRLPSPARPDFMLEVESAPQDPDIFADAETDYFSSADKNDGPRAYRRHFFDAMPSIESQASGKQTSSQLTSK